MSTSQVSSDNRWLALYVLCTGMLMIVLDASIVNVALPSIQDDLEFSQNTLAWVVNAYIIPFGGLLLLAGRLGPDPGGDRRGDDAQDDEHDERAPGPQHRRDPRDLLDRTVRGLREDDREVDDPDERERDERRPHGAFGHGHGIPPDVKVS